jgi:hypothetical protein
MTPPIALQAAPTRHREVFSVVETAANAWLLQMWFVPAEFMPSVPCLRWQGSRGEFSVQI